MPLLSRDLPSRIARAIPPWFLAWCLTVAALFQPAAVLGARVSWVLDALTHLVVPSVILFGVAAAVWFGLRRPIRGAVCLGIGIVLALPLFGFNRPSPIRPDPNSGDRLRILIANVLNDNPRHDAFTRLVEAENPDIVGIVEYSRPWLEALEANGLRARYPHRVEFPAGGRGIAIWSRVKPHRLEPPQAFTPLGNPVMKLTLPFGDNLTTVWVVHPPNPIGPLRQTATLDLLALGEQIGLRGGSQIVVGDLNRTEASPYYHDFLRESGLRDSRQGFGRQPTWPTGSPIKIPLDHAFVSDDIAVLDRRVGPNIGSDHLPVIVDFAPAVKSRN